MSSIRDRAHAHADNTPTRKQSEPFPAPWPGEHDEAEMIAVRELGAQNRLDLMSGVQVDTKNQTGKIDLSLLLPVVTDLIVDPDSSKPVFELADHDWLVEKYPSLVQKAILTSVGISDLGDDDLQDAEGNSKASLSVEPSTAS